MNTESKNGQENPEQETNKEPVTGEQNTAPRQPSDSPSAEDLQQEIASLKDKYLRSVSEFENFKKRNARERLELIKYAGEEIFSALLPVLDDFDRALKSMEAAPDTKAVKEGIALIHNKLKTILLQKGLQEMASTGTVFNTDLHDAITNQPAPSEEMKGKVIEELEKGYYLNGKVIRHAKVVVGK
jgi:molecular chaperone GrpE